MVCEEYISGMVYEVEPSEVAYDVEASGDGDVYCSGDGDVYISGDGAVYCSAELYEGSGV